MELLSRYMSLSDVSSVLVSADTQAIKPKVSRIHARCIFPKDVASTRLKGSPAHTEEGLEKKEAKPPPRGRFVLGFRALAVFSGACSSVLAAPRKRGAFSLVGFCTLNPQLLLREAVFLVWSYSELCFHSADSGVWVAMPADLKHTVDGLKQSYR